MVVPKFLNKLRVLGRKMTFGSDSRNYVVWTTQSLNLLLSSSSRLIYASRECLKSRFCGENGKKSLLECQTLFSKSQNEKPLI